MLTDDLLGCGTDRSVESNVEHGHILEFVEFIPVTLTVPKYNSSDDYEVPVS